MSAVQARALAIRRPERHQPVAERGTPSRRQAARDRGSDRMIAPADASRIPVHSAERPVPSLSPAGPAMLQRCGGTPCPPGGCDHDEEPTVQRQAASPAPGLTGRGVPPSAHEVVRSPGWALPPAVRQLMEPRFGYDFGEVRVHTDAAAARSARTVGARAYTVGRDVVFGDGQFTPDSAAGRRLIAHELAHVIQQRAGGGHLAAPPLTVSDPSDPAEKEADRAADAALAPTVSDEQQDAGLLMPSRAPDPSCVDDPLRREAGRNGTLQRQVDPDDDVHIGSAPPDSTQAGSAEPDEEPPRLAALITKVEELKATVAAVTRYQDLPSPPEGRTEIGGATKCDPTTGKPKWAINRDAVPSCMWTCAEVHEETHAEFMRQRCEDVGIAFGRTEFWIRVAGQYAKQNKLDEVQRAMNELEVAVQEATQTTARFGTYMDQTCRYDEGTAYSAGIDACNADEARNRCTAAGQSADYARVMAAWQRFMRNPPNCATAAPAAG